jgi:translation initiation factor 2B subunit (eIF-2B alpha/beta/delta family)
MKHYGFDKNNLIHYKNQTDTFDKIEKTADITDQILAKLSIINLAYDKVYENYMNGIITEVQ